MHYSLKNTGIKGEIEVNNFLGIVNLDEDQRKMGELVKKRNLAAVPIGARYRIIDFVLSNMNNSGIETIGIFVNNNARALVDHLKNGRPWDLHRRNGLKVFNFSDEDLVFDDIHSFADNLEYIKNSKKKYILLAPSYMICNIDYNEVFAEHESSGNEITLVYKNTNRANEYFIGCDVLDINENGKLVSVEKNAGRKINNAVSMEMYIMSTDLFIDIVLKSIRSGLYKKVKEFINDNLDKVKVGCYEYKGYTACVNSLKSYYKANMDLLSRKVNNELFQKDRPILTKTKDEGPTLYTPDSKVSNSIIANGCYIEGEVKNSIIGRRVHIHKGCKIEDSIILQNSDINKNVRLSNVITDKGSNIDEFEYFIGSEQDPIVIAK